MDVSPEQDIIVFLYTYAREFRFCFRDHCTRIRSICSGLCPKKLVNF